MTALNAVSSFHTPSASGPLQAVSLEGLARRGDGSELRAFIRAYPDQAAALETALARHNPSALYEIQPEVELPPVVVTGTPPPADDGKSWLARGLDGLRGFVQDHDGSETIAQAGDWVGDRIDDIRSDVPVLSQAAGVTRGVLGFGKDVLQGVVSLPGMAVNGTVATAQTGVALAEGRTTPGELVDQGVAVARAVPGAVAAPVTEAWARGDHVEAVTRGIAEIATLPLLPAKGGAAARIADGVADGARAADAAGDVARAADAAGDAGRAADGLRPVETPPRAPEAPAPRPADTAPTPARVEREVIEMEAGGPGGWNRALNGELRPNADYLVNGYRYSTDDQGRVFAVNGQLTLETAPRNGYQQGKKADLGIEGDQGGHWIASIFNGPGEALNLYPQNGNFNMGVWRALENQWSDALRDGKTVEVDIQARYEASGGRPTGLSVTYIIDGQPRTRTFQNQPGG